MKSRSKEDLMWWVKTDSSGEEQGGFQNRDVGKTSFQRDFGPDYGVDYARLNDTPDIKKDLHLKEQVIGKLQASPTFKEMNLEVKVKNGFVFVSGELTSLEIRKELNELLFAIDGVVEIVPTIG